jgi:hypothetical protein
MEKIPVSIGTELMIKLAVPAFTEISPNFSAT